MNSKVIWITGLSGAGKSTISREVVLKLRDFGMPVVLLDGDELRELFGAVATNTQNHGRAGRIDLAMKYSYLCQMLASQGLTVVIATISLFHEIHDWNRRNLPGYFEVYLRVPIKILQHRDPKGIYRKYKSGELQNVAGLDLVIDEPELPDMVFNYDKEQKPVDIANEVIKQILENKGSHGGK
jgi:cytidine diphosphoramidate kinase